MNIEEQFVEKLGQYNYEECKRILSTISPEEQKKLIEGHLIGTDWIPNGVVDRDIMNNSSAEDFLTYLADTANQLGIKLEEDFAKGDDIVEIVNEHPELDFQSAVEMAFDEYNKPVQNGNEGPFAAPSSAVRGNDYIDYSDVDYHSTPEQISEPITEPEQSMEQGRTR